MKKILIAGANGFIGINLTRYLIKKNYKVRVFVRNKNKFQLKNKKIEIFIGTLEKKSDLNNALENIDTAFYLAHSMSQTKDFERLEKLCAKNFADACSENKVKRIIYLGGISNDKKLSPHLRSRKIVGDILRKSSSKVTELQASIIVGKHSPSFIIISKISEKIKFVPWPYKINSLCQPIALNDVLYYLEACLHKKETEGKIFCIGGPTKLKYYELLKVYANEIGKKMIIIKIPFFPKKIISFFISRLTNQKFSLVNSLIESIKYDSICINKDIKKIFPRKLLSYQEAIRELR